MAHPDLSFREHGFIDDGVVLIPPDDAAEALPGAEEFLRTAVRQHVDGKNGIPEVSLRLAHALVHRLHVHDRSRHVGAPLEVPGKIGDIIESDGRTFF